MRIEEVSNRSGLSQDTIRFYEKSGMLPTIDRDGRGWRQFSPEDLDWLTVLERLRATGMPLKAVRAFAASAHGPDAETEAEQKKRLTLLQEHAQVLSKRRAKLDECEAYLNHKINIYTSILEG